MKLIHNDIRIYNYFQKYIITPFKVLGIDLEPFLMGYTIYLGIDPTPGTAFPNIRIAEKIIELPFTFVNIFGHEPRYILEDCKLGIHEMFHAIHFSDKWDWQKWARETGNELKLEYVDARIQTPSYEKVAWDGAKLLNFDLPNWYIAFLGGKKTINYRIGNAAYVLAQAGLVTGDWYNNKRDAILSKYYKDQK